MELAESVGLARLVVLDRLGPSERVAFVLHDLFAVPFDEIAPIVERSPATTKKLASRARHRVRGGARAPDADLAGHTRIVEAFLAAARGGDLDALLTLLAPDVVRRADRTAIPAGVAPVLRGARAVAEETPAFAHRARFAAVALVDGHVGAVIATAGRLRAAILVAVDAGAITEFEIVADPARLAGLEITVLPEPEPEPEPEAWAVSRRLATPSVRSPHPDPARVDRTKAVHVMRKLLAASLTAALAFLGSAAIAAPAAHAEACTYRFSADVDSGVSTAWADFYSCQDGYGSWWTVTGRLYDTSCDNRTAYLDIHAEGSGGATRSVSGCGNSRYYSVSFPTPVWGFKLRTRACNTTCSNEDSIWVYP